jgi:hypothetical protein
LTLPLTDPAAAVAGYIQGEKCTAVLWSNGRAGKTMYLATNMASFFSDAAIDQFFLCFSRTFGFVT